MGDNTFLFNLEMQKKNISFKWVAPQLKVGILYLKYRFEIPKERHSGFSLTFYKVECSEKYINYSITRPPRLPPPTILLFDVFPEGECLGKVEGRKEVSSTPRSPAAPAPSPNLQQSWLKNI